MARRRSIIPLAAAQKLSLLRGKRGRRKTTKNALLPPPFPLAFLRVFARKGGGGGRSSCNPLSRIPARMMITMKVLFIASAEYDASFSRRR